MHEVVVCVALLQLAKQSATETSTFNEVATRMFDRPEERRRAAACDHIVTPGIANDPQFPITVI